MPVIRKHAPINLPGRHVWANTPATTEDSAQNLDHHVEAVPFVPGGLLQTSKWCQASTSQQHLGGVRCAASAGTVHTPAKRYLLPLPMAHFYLAHWHGGGGHVQLEAVCGSSRAIARDGVGSSSPLHRTRRHHERACVREGETDQSLAQRKIRPEASNAEVVAAATHYKSHTRSFRLCDAKLHRKFRHHSTQPILPIHIGSAFSLRCDSRISPTIDETCLDLAAIHLRTIHPVRWHTSAICCNKNLCHQCGILRRDPDLLKAQGHEMLELSLGNTNFGSGLYHCTGAL
mmetsp:Transcript_99921/g.213956  ORF Transcript_99921/g.213956 Transcript_99921/m.213956 type:complete len:288 (+) Transcript_99921:428-1291(+)